MLKTARDHGDVAYTRFAGFPTYLITHPDGIEHVLVGNRANYPKSDLIQRFRPLLGEGLLTSTGEGWARQRKMMSPTFQHKRVQSFAAAMVAATTEHVDRWTAGTVHSVNEDMMRLTLDIAVRTLFGSSAKDDASRVSRALDDVSEYFAKTISQPISIPLSIPTQLNRAFLGAKRELDDIVHRIIADKRNSTERGPDLLSHMLDLQDEDGHRMSDKQLRDEVLTLLLAGHETTALTLTYAFHLLAENPGEDALLAEELARVLGDRPPTLADLPKLVRTQQIVKEAMRLFPPAAVLIRKALADDRIGGFDIPAGALAVMPQWVTHRDPRFFARPERFLPGRWTPEMEKSLPRFAYFPFGGGPRVCIGSAFAMLEAQLVLAGVAQRFQFSNPERPLELQISITIRPKHPLRMRADAREKSGTRTEAPIASGCPFAN